MNGTDGSVRLLKCSLFLLQVLATMVNLRPILPYVYAMVIMVRSSRKGVAGVIHQKV